MALDSFGATIPGSRISTNNAVFALLEQFNGGIILGGDFTAIAGASGTFPRLARLTPDLRVDPVFDTGTGPNAGVESLLRSPEGWIYVFGRFTAFNGRPRPAGIARIGPTGRLDENYNPPLIVQPGSLGADLRAPGQPARGAGGRLEANNGILLPNGGIVAPPSLTKTGGVQKITAINPNGSISETLDVNVNGLVSSLAAASNDGITMAGDFSSIGGTTRRNVGAVTGDSGGSRIINLSTRGRVAGGERNLILGFVIKGPEAMRVLIRGVGPTLRDLGINDPLPRPQLIVYDAANRVVTENVSWRAATNPEGLAEAMRQVGAFTLNSADDTAVILNLAPGNYTAEIRGQNGTQGVALGEVYAIDRGSSRIINLSVRGAVGRDDDVLIPAFVISGGARLLLMRAVGPTLTKFEVSGALARPFMELRGNGRVLETNQGWANGLDPAAIEARSAMVGAFALPARSADSVIFTALSEGAYTVTASGGDGGTGVALVEIYDANGVEASSPK